MEKLFISLHLDEDVSVKVAASLHHMGVNAVCIVEAKNVEKSDKEQLKMEVAKQKPC